MRRSRRATMLAAFGLFVATAESARAVQGVESLHFSPGGSVCLPDQALPCDEYAGEGESNIVYVHQREIGGQYVFDTLEVPGIPDGQIWVAANYGAECKFGYHLHTAEVATGAYDDSGKGGDPVQVNPYWTSWPIEYSTSKKVYDQLVNLWVPIDSAFGAEGAPGSVFFFDDASDVFDYGEDEIADRVSAGMSEEAARGQSFSFDTFIGMHGFVRCKGDVFGREGWIAKGAWVPLKFVFVGLGNVAELQEQPPVLPEAPTDQIKVPVSLTQAFLHVAPDAQDSCRLRLTGAFTTNGPTDISYRFVDELGLKSQIFTTSVDQTFVAMIDHYVDLPEVERPDGEIDQLVIEEENDVHGELTATPTDNEQGYYQIEVLEPHGYWSNVSGYNVPPCQPGPALEGGGLTAPTRLPPPPGDFQPGGKVAG